MRVVSGWFVEFICICFSFQSENRGLTHSCPIYRAKTTEIFTKTKTGIQLNQFLKWSVL